MSTNKVYGDLPNTIALKELETRWDYADPAYANGIPETFSIDQSKHSLFGASKVAADVMVQEYGRYFSMPTSCLRGGCLTGPNHSGVELHGFLSYLVKCNLEEREYTIFGYKGKQVRDNIHSEDVARFAYEFYSAPRCGEVYNLGGGKENTCSILEAFELVSELSGKPQKYRYVDQHRIGDHICYYSDLTKVGPTIPQWDITKNLRKPSRKSCNPGATGGKMKILDHGYMRFCGQHSGQSLAGGRTGAGDFRDGQFYPARQRITDRTV